MSGLIFMMLFDSHQACHSCRQTQEHSSLQTQQLSGAAAIIGAAMSCHWHQLLP
jgi:hypothetical protein